jgi:hypothetical protein
MTLSPISLGNQPRLAVWILAMSLFHFSAGSEGGRVVARAFGYLEGFAVGFFHFRRLIAASRFATLRGGNLTPKSFRNALIFVFVSQDPSALFRI